MSKPNCLKLPMLWGAAIAIAALTTSHLAAAVPSSDAVAFAPHRAVYDLTLLKSRGSSGVDALRGRILYDFTGNSCEGYELQFRQVSEFDSREGKPALRDLRSTTWEDGAAQKFRFSSENLLNDQRTDSVDGHAERGNSAVKVSLSKPTDKNFTVPRGVVFPTEHMRRIIAAARAGKGVLNFPVYDGSETGDKIYNTLTVIGKAIAPGQKPPDDAAAQFPQLAKLPRWPVSISYFDQETDKEQRSGEQTPVYAISFELYENGISRALTLEYADFTISGKMTALELKKPKPCAPPR
jgi:EipB-like